MQSPLEMRCDPSFAKLLPQNYLSSLESHPHVVHGLWPDLSLAYFNPQWSLFAEQNGGKDMLSAWPLGRSMLQAVPEVGREYYEMFYAAALSCDSAHPKEHEYECSSAEVFRKFVMMAYPLRAGAQMGLVVVHSLKAEWLHVDTAPTSMPPTAQLYTQSTGLIRQCMHCRRVHRADESDSWDWVPAWVREPQDNVTHSLCAVCLEHYYAS